MTMLSANGTAYRCYIPEVAPAAEDSGPVSTVRGGLPACRVAGSAMGACLHARLPPADCC